MNYGSKGTKKELKSLTTNNDKIKTSVRVTVFKVSLTAITCLLITGICMAVGMIKGIIDSAPDITTLDISPGGLASTVLDNQGNVIETLVTSGSNRELVEYEDIPQSMIDAFVAIEDARFWTHNGIDFKGITRAAFTGISSGRFSEGASTITQQLIKNVVFDGGAESNFGDKITRKLQEQYLAVQLEKNMPKETILLYYLNTINLGSNTLGVEAASERYFGKSVSELTLSECTVIASITQNPSAYNPITHPEDNADKRAIVLNYMVEQGYINEKEKEEALADNVYERIEEVNDHVTSQDHVYSYFVDHLIGEVIEDLQTKAGYSEAQARSLLYSGGLKIITTQDPVIQQIVDEEISDPENYGSMVRYSFTYRLSVTHADETTQHYSEAHIKAYLRKQQLSAKLIFDTKEEIQACIDNFKAATLTDADEIIGESVDITLQPQASFVIMDQNTGYVKAISGGRGEKTVSLGLNRATGSLRQPGSAFKVLTAFAPALDTSGATLGSVYYDAPYTLNDKSFSNWWQSGYVGYANIRQGITYSMNIVALKTLMETVSPQLGYQYAVNFGITTLVDNRVEDNGNVRTDIGATLCLGGITDGVSNLELTAAYASIANRGVYTEPVFYTQILDQNGKVIINNTPETHTVIKESTAFLLTSAMQDVVGNSHLFNIPDIGATSPNCKIPNMSTAGKSGTTSDYNDVWFVGYTPYYTAAIWEGYDENATIEEPKNVRTIWANIMTRIHEGLEDPGFGPVPAGIETAKICSKSGKLAIEGVCEYDPRGDMTYTEYFVRGTAPTDYCNHHTKVKICDISSAIANEYCPDSTAHEQVFTLITEPETGDTSDSLYKLPDELMNNTCTVHTFITSLFPQNTQNTEGSGTDTSGNPNDTNSSNDGT